MEKNGVNGVKFESGFVWYYLKVTKLSLVDALLRMFDFSGRTSRRSYWIAAIIFGLCSIISLACSIWALNWNLGTHEITARHIFKGLCYFFLFIQASLFVRRNHDLGDSIWDMLNPFNFQNYMFLGGKNVFDLGEPDTNKFGPPHSL
jgi:hypothetical protein